MNDGPAWVQKIIINSSGLPDDYQFRYVRAVAVSRSGDIAVLDRAEEDVDVDRVHVFSKNDGSHFILEEGKDVNDVAALPNGHWVVVSFSSVTVFNGDGLYIRNVYLPPSDFARRASSYPLSVDINGNTLFIGDEDPKKITFLNGSDGVKMGSFRLEIPPIYIAVSRSLFLGKMMIAACDLKEVAVFIQDNSGGLAFTSVFNLSKFCINGEDGAKPCGIVFDYMQNLYVAVASVTSVGHVHRYSPSGEYSGCIFKHIQNPGGMAYVDAKLSELGSESESLFVANQSSVVKLSKQ